MFTPPSPLSRPGPRFPASTVREPGVAADEADGSRIVASRAGEGGKTLYRGDVCTGWDYRKGSRWNDYWWHDDWDDDW